MNRTHSIEAEKGLNIKADKQNLKEIKARNFQDYQIENCELQTQRSN